MNSLYRLDINVIVNRLSRVDSGWFCDSRKCVMSPDMWSEEAKNINMNRTHVFLVTMSLLYGEGIHYVDQVEFEKRE